MKQDRRRRLVQRMLKVGYRHLNQNRNSPFPDDTTNYSMPKRRKKVDLEQRQVREIYEITEEDETSVVSEENGQVNGQVV
jgi:hypothetical protein